jgi:hypothetical protein
MSRFLVNLDEDRSDIWTKKTYIHENQQMHQLFIQFINYVW